MTFLSEHDNCSIISSVNELEILEAGFLPDVSPGGSIVS